MLVSHRYADRSAAAESARRQAQEAIQAQAQASEEEVKASKLADQAERRAATEQGSGNLAAAVAASAAATKYVYELCEIVDDFYFIFHHHCPHRYH